MLFSEQLLTNHINYHIFHKKTVMRSKWYREQFQILSRIIVVGSPLEPVNSITMGSWPDLCYYDFATMKDAFKEKMVDLVDLSQSISATSACSGIS